MAVQPQPATEAPHGHAHAAAQAHAKAVCPTSAVQRNDGSWQFQVVLLSTLLTSLNPSFFWQHSWCLDAAALPLLV